MRLRKWLRPALAELERERADITKKIATLTEVLDDGARKPLATATGRRGRRPWTAAQRQAVSRRMRAYWAKRRRSA